MTTIDLLIERGDDSTNDWRELTVEVRGTVTPYVPARIHGPADFWHEAEGGEVEDVEVYCASEEVELTPKELARAEEMLRERAREDADEARATRADWERDSRRDARYGL